MAPFYILWQDHYIRNFRQTVLLLLIVHFSSPLPHPVALTLSIHTLTTSHDVCQFLVRNNLDGPSEIPPENILPTTLVVFKVVIQSCFPKRALRELHLLCPLSLTHLPDGCKESYLLFTCRYKVYEMLRGRTSICLRLLLWDGLWWENVMWACKDKGIDKSRPIRTPSPKYPISIVFPKLPFKNL